MLSDKTIENIKHLREDGVFLEDVTEELNYRDNAGGDARWDDYLCQYTDEELADIEEHWTDVF